MVATYKIGPEINGEMSECSLITVRNFFFFVSPVEDNDDQLCTIFFDFFNILFQLFLSVEMIIKFINTDHTDFDTINLRDRGFIIAKMNDTCCVQGT